MKTFTALLLLLLVGCSSASKPHAFRIVDRGEDGLHEYWLEWRDSTSAKPIPLGIDPVRFLLSPDRRAAVFNGDARLVDLVHRRVYVPKIGGPQQGCASGPIMWKRQDRLVITVVCDSVHATSRADLLVFDPGARRFVGRREVGPGFLKGLSTTAGQILLTSPRLGPVSAGSAREERLGLARLIRVRPSGQADEITLPIRMGSAHGRTLNRWPGFVVDGSRRHVYVVGEDDGVVRIDARTLHAEPARLRDAFAAQQELATRPRRKMGTVAPSRSLEREVLSLPGGLLVVTGSDTWARSVDYEQSAPAGLKLVDIRRWSVRMLDARISTVTRIPGGFLATGPGAGLRAYDLKGRLRSHRFAHQYVWVISVSAGHAEVVVRETEDGPRREGTIDLP